MYMSNDAYLQIRTALDSTTERVGGDQRTDIGAVFILKDIDRMVREVRNKTVDFIPHVARRSMRQLAYIWNLETNINDGTSKTAVYSDGGTGTPRPNRYLQLFAPAISYRSDYEVTGITIAASASYWDALDREARSALQSHLLTEEQMFLLGDDATAESAGLTLNAQIGVTDSFLGLKPGQLLSSAKTISAGTDGGFADSSTVYGSQRSSTVTDRQFSLNVQTVNTAANAQNPLSVKNLNSAITVSNIAGAKNARRLFLVSEHRMDEISDLIAPQGRYVVGARMQELDGGMSVLSWKNIPFIASRLMTYFGATSSNGSSIVFGDTDTAFPLLDMDNISFYSVNGVDARHVPVIGADASQRSDVEGGWFKTYGIFVVEKFNTQVVIWNLETPN